MKSLLAALLLLRMRAYRPIIKQKPAATMQAAPKMRRGLFFVLVSIWLFRCLAKVSHLLVFPRPPIPTHRPPTFELDISDVPVPVLPLQVIHFAVMYTRRICASSYLYT